MRPSEKQQSAHRDRVPRTSAQRPNGTEFPGERVPNGHRVPSNPKSIQIKMKGGCKLLTTVRWSLKRKFGLKNDFKQILG